MYVFATQLLLKCVVNYFMLGVPKFNLLSASVLSSPDLFHVILWSRYIEYIYIATASVYVCVPDNISISVCSSVNI